MHNDPRFLQLRYYDVSTRSCVVFTTGSRQPSRSNICLELAALSDTVRTDDALNGDPRVFTE